jgi:hypothetical protein
MSQFFVEYTASHRYLMCNYGGLVGVVCIKTL